MVNQFIDQGRAAGPKEEDLSVGILIPAAGLQPLVEAAVKRFERRTPWIRLRLERVVVEEDDGVKALMEVVCRLLDSGVAGLILLQPGASLPLIQDLGIRLVFSMSLISEPIK